MQKDYYPVDTLLSSKNEIDRIEDYWTNKWKDVRNAEFLQVGRSEEYQRIRSILNSLPQGATILDGGCGLGAWARYLQEKSFRITGVDISQITVEKLQRDYPNIEFVHADIRAMDFPSNHFDCYYSWGTFEHFESGLGDCFREAHRVLKQDGLLIITVPYQNLRHILIQSLPLQRWDSEYSAEIGYESKQCFYQWRFRDQEIVREMEINGFRVISASRIHKTEGVRRCLNHQFGVTYDSILNKVLKRVLSKVIPSWIIAHMIIVVGRRN